jgi:hypothetical protein
MALVKAPSMKRNFYALAVRGWDDGLPSQINLSREHHVSSAPFSAQLVLKIVLLQSQWRACSLRQKAVKRVGKRAQQVSAHGGHG